MRNPSARTPAALLIASVLGFAFAAPVSAEIYKWTDARGVVNYTNTRPANQAAELVRENQLSIVAPLKPSAEEVRALNERLLNRRISRLEEELRAQRNAPAVAYAPPVDSGVYYPSGGGFYGGPADPPLGEIIIDRDRNGRSRNTNIQFIPRYEVRPGPYGVGAQAVPVQPRERRRLEARRFR